MSQKTIPFLNYNGFNLLSNSDFIEIDNHRNEISYKLTLQNLANAIFAKFSFNSKRIKTEIEKAANKTEYDSLILIDEKGGKWKLYVDTSDNDKLKGRQIEEGGE